MSRTTILLTAAVSALALSACSPNAKAPEQTAAPAPQTADLIRAEPAPSADIPADIPATGTALNDLYTWLHANPELSFKEIRSSAIMANELKSLGFDVTTGLGDAWAKAKSTRDYGTVRDGVGGYGVVGVLKNGEGPTVLIRADMDALPVAERTDRPFASKVVDETWTGVENGVMHACGHDIHMTSWVGTARNLVANKDKWSGTLVMIAQPAEEIGLGATAMVDDGLFTRFPKPDYNLGLHVSAGLPSGKVGYSSGFALANVDSVDITVKGVGGHGAYPHTTKDPIVIGSAIVMAVHQGLGRMLDARDPSVLAIGAIHAGDAHNIIPGLAQLKGTVRTLSHEQRARVEPVMRQLIDGVCATWGARATLSFVRGAPAVVNDARVVDTLRRCALELLPPERVLDIALPSMGGEDFSQYLSRAPGAMFRLGTGGEGRRHKLHSPRFNPEEGAIRLGASLLARAALALLLQHRS